ncbi:hypothetical protein VTL71DRAFT_9485 [Oculimacula yallundae]|uniref:Uncharacterized protein n=1 Tax=Oculimacula yallundae TaxID=86028 RepID=A0ABR4BTS3_9HELO
MWPKSKKKIVGGRAQWR